MPSTNGHGSKPERISLYLRVSSEEQRDAGTIETQREFLLRHAERSGFEVAETYADDGISGTVPLHKRPEGARLLEDAATGSFQTMLIYKLDRLGRTQLGILNAADRLEGMSVALRSATEHFETVSSQGRLMFQMLGSFAEFERASIKERTRDGLHGHTAMAGRREPSPTATRSPGTARWHLCRSRRRLSGRYSRTSRRAPRSTLR
jgi:DNA invertase Pin-like site-specific DNA recombinase